MRRAGFKVYSIHLPPPYSARGAEPEALREGFCFAAFLFTVVWALANRMWIPAAILFVLMVAAFAVAALIGLDPAGQAAVGVAIMAWAGMEGNDWQREALAKRGWREAGVIAAESEDAALRRFGDLSTLGAPPEPPAPPTAPRASAAGGPQLA